MACQILLKSHNEICKSFAKARFWQELNDQISEVCVHGAQQIPRLTIRLWALAHSIYESSSLSDKTLLLVDLTRLVEQVLEWRD